MQELVICPQLQRAAPLPSQDSINYCPYRHPPKQPVITISSTGYAFNMMYPSLTLRSSSTTLPEGVVP